MSESERDNRPSVMLSDVEFMLRCLTEKPHTTSELIDRSRIERGCRFTPHSRAPELRRRGHQIHCQRIPGRRSRPEYRYTLIQPAEQLELGAA